MSILIQLLPILLPLIMNCVDDDGEEATIKRIKKRPGLVQWKAYRAARKKGATKAEARAQAAEVWDTIEACDEEDLKELIMEARADS